MASQSLSAEGNRNFVGHACRFMIVFSWKFFNSLSSHLNAKHFALFHPQQPIVNDLGSETFPIDGEKNQLRDRLEKLFLAEAEKLFFRNLHNWWKSKFLTWKRSLWSIWPTIQASAGLYAFPIFHSSPLRRCASSFMMRKSALSLIYR